MRGKREVISFAKLMLEVINRPKNLAKGDWNRMSIEEMLVLLRLEIEELEAECNRPGEKNDVTRRLLAYEAADVACFAMFIADKYACFAPPRVLEI